MHVQSLDRPPDYAATVPDDRHIVSGMYSINSVASNIPRNHMLSSLVHHGGLLMEIGFSQSFTIPQTSLPSSRILSSMFCLAMCAP
jgi:hypothetical protein